MAKTRLLLVVPFLRLENKYLHHEDIAKSNLQHIYDGKRKGLRYDFPKPFVGARPSKAEPPWREATQQSGGRGSKAVIFE